MFDAIGPIESQLLALERKQARIDRELQTRSRNLRAIGQGLWDSWSDQRMLRSTPAPPVPMVSDFPSMCPNIPETLQLNDSYYGITTPFVYQSSSRSWKACAIVNKPATNTGFCVGPNSYVGGNTPIFYRLVGDDTTDRWDLFVQWHRDPVNGGPQIGATCSATAYTGLVIRMTQQITCSPFSYTSSFTMQPTGCDRIYPANASITIAITEP